MSGYLSYILYFASFAPLWMSVIFIDCKSLFIDKTEYRYTEILSIVLIILGMILSIIILCNRLYRQKLENSIQYEIKIAKEQKTVTADFLLTYILPLFAFDFTKWFEVFLFLLFFILLGYLTTNHHIFSANIILDIMKFRFYECTLITPDRTEVELIILSRKPPTDRIGEKINMKTLNNELKLEVV